MLVTGSPQFDAQDDFGDGEGVCAIKEWQSQFSTEDQKPDLLDFCALGFDPMLGNTVNHLRTVFGVFQAQDHPVILSTTDLHDLTCFTLHRLLSLPSLTGVDYLSTNTSECLRYGISLYMFIVHGPTYYSHANLLNALVLQLEHYLNPLLSFFVQQDSLLVWFLSVGAVASIGTSESQWFRGRAATVSLALEVRSWPDVEAHLKRVLWLETATATTTRVLFEHTWEDIITSN